MPDCIVKQGDIADIPFNRRAKSTVIGPRTKDCIHLEPGGHGSFRYDVRDRGSVRMQMHSSPIGQSKKSRVKARARPEACGVRISTSP